MCIAGRREARKTSQLIPKSEGELSAQVRWDGSRFTVTNEGSFDCQFVILQVNGGTNAYLYPVSALAKGKAIKVPAREFFHGASFKKLDVSKVELLTFVICEGDPYSYDSILRFWRGVIYKIK